MATIHGKNGIVKVGAGVVAEVQNWSITESVDMVEKLSMGDTSASYLVGAKRWNGSLSCLYDKTDSDGQVLLVNGASVTLGLYPEGDASGDIYKTGTAIIGEVEQSVPKDGIVSINFTFTGSGDLTETTV